MIPRLLNKTAQANLRQGMHKVAARMAYKRGLALPGGADEITLKTAAYLIGLEAFKLRREKQAMLEGALYAGSTKTAGIGGAIGGAFSPIAPIYGGAIGAGLEDDSLRSAAGGGLGSLVGMFGGAAGGAGLGALLQLALKRRVDPSALSFLAPITAGGLIGGPVGGHLGQEIARD
jgi:hypothetical protein